MEKFGFRFGHPRSWTAVALTAALALFVSACGGTPPSDTTAPQLTGHTPASGATGVLLASPIVLEFDEAIAPASISPASLKVLDGSQELGYTAAPSADGKTLTLTLTSAPAALPAQLTVQLNGLADAAGNPVQASFAFTTADDWIKLGDYVQEDLSGDADHPSAALDADGRLVVAYDYAASAGYRIAVRRWNGSAWENIGAPFNSGSSDGAQNPDLVLDSTGNPVVAWVEYNATNRNNVFVRHWDGSQWKPYTNSGEILDLTDSNSATTPTIALTSNDDPAVAFAEQSTVSGTTAWHVYHGGFDGNLGWIFQSSPDNYASGEDASSPVAAMNSDNEMVLAWVENSASGKGIYVKNVATGFLGTLPLKHADGDFIPYMDMALDTDGNPVVVWREQSNGSGLYAKRYDGSAWQNFGSSDLVNASGFYLAMALDASGYPVIAYSASNGGSTNLLVTRWDGAAWVALPGSVNLDPTQELYSFDCVLDGNGNPVVVWGEDDGSGGFVLHAARYNGLAK
ncbi:Ig-like domain-containing protein [Oceanithermus desulfurans]|nr:Ig-like domain-containing protein [Oceanithermus desulfurans]MBB6028830.1 hypothetical protein [Oceanithermus desulfurans]